MSYIERLEIPAGWLNISCPELTAVDMVAYQEQKALMWAGAATIGIVFGRFTIGIFFRKSI